MKKVMGIVALAALIGACKSGSQQDSQPAGTTPPEAAETAAATVGTSGEAAATGGEAGNILGLELPTIDKSQENWKYGVPQPKPFPAKFDPRKDYFATIHTTLGDMTVKFFPEVAPKHATSFIYLSQIGYYDNVPFHRVCEGFMMQGGDPSGQGNGGPRYRIPQEFNPRKHVKGILSAARTPDPNSAGSQFFVMFDPAPFLDDKYTVFGQVVEGMKTVDAFEKRVAVKDPSGRCKPKSLEKIESVDVFTKDKG